MPPAAARSDRGQQLFVGGFFEHVTQRAGTKGLAGEGGVVLHGQDHDRRRRRLREQARDRLKTGAAGHVEVEDEHSRPVFVREAFSVWDRLGLGDDL